MSQKFNWITVSKKGYTAFASGNYKEAESLFLECLKRVKRYARKDPRLAYTYKLIGRSLYMQSEYMKAQPFLRQAIKLYRPYNLYESVQDLWWLALSYEKRGQMLRAAQVYMQGVKITANPNYSDKSAPASWLTEAARCYWNGAKYDVAETIFRRALQEAKSEAGSIKTISSTAATLIDIVRSAINDRARASRIKRLSDRAYAALSKRMSKLEAPRTKSVSQRDDYFGKRISDPYRWLEEVEAPEVNKWLESQATNAQSYLQAIPGRTAVLTRLRKLFESEPPRLFYAVGNYYFCEDMLRTKLFRTTRIGKAPKVVLDSTKFAKDSILSATSVSPNGGLVAYWISQKGSDWQSIHIKNLRTGRVLPDLIQDQRASVIAWKPDSSGFYYCSFFRNEKFQKIMFHKAGSAQSTDTLIYQFTDSDMYANISITSKGKHLVVTTARGESDLCSIFLLNPSARNRSILSLVPEQNSSYYFIGRRGNQLYFITNKNAAMSRIVSANIENSFFKPIGKPNETRPNKSSRTSRLAAKKDQSTGKPRWHQVVAERADCLKRAFVWNNELFCLHDTEKGEEIECFNLKDRKRIALLRLPAHSTLGPLRFLKYPHVALGIHGYTIPHSMYHLDLKHPSFNFQSSMQTEVDTTNLVIEKFYARSADGRRVPFFVRYKKGLELNGDNPTILTGYGGFNRVVSPSFNFYDMLWLEQGGVCVEAILRGDGGLGSKWRDEGKREDKQKTFDDFIAVAKELIRRRFTKPARLGIKGHSNGGLLVGAALTQSAHLFGAVMIGSGLLDMLRYHHFGAERHFSSEYGCADNKHDFEILSAYSPVHNIRRRHYPPVLIMTGSHDDRVRPAHSYKFAATMQKKQAAEAPILLRVELNAGHSGLKQSMRGIDEWLFFAHTLGMLPGCLLNSGCTLR